MRVHTYKALGIVLKRTNFGEADKLLTIFTKQYGKITCLGKGMRKLTSRKAASLELFNLAAIFLAKGKNLDIVTETQLVNSFRGWRKELEKVALAYQFCELVDRFTSYHQEHWQIFELLLEGLQALENDDLNLAHLRDQFKVSLLRESGFGLPQAQDSQSLNRFIEHIIEKKLNSQHLLEKL